MNFEISETKRTKSTKFVENVFYYCAQIQTFLALGHAPYRLQKSLKIELQEY